MNTAPIVEIFCDGNTTVGYGHLRRSLTLAARLRRDGLRVRVTGLSSDATKILDQSERFSRDEESANLVKVAVFDSPLDVGAQIEDHRRLGRKTVALDCFSSVAPDINVVVFSHGRDVKAVEKSYVGFDYILIRDEILAAQEWTRDSFDDRVTVMIGGGDLLQQGHRAARAATELGYKVSLIQGPLAKDVTSDDSFEVVVNPPDLPRRLAESSWIATNGGGCLFESLYLKKAVCVLPQTEAEQRIADFVAKKDALLGIGLRSLRRYSDEELQRVRLNTEGLVDGRGAARISEIIRTVA